MTPEEIQAAFAADAAKNKKDSETLEKMGLNLDFIGDAFQSVDDIVYAFDKNARADQLAIAQANASAAQASATAFGAKPKSNTIIWVGVIGAVLVVAILLISRR